MLGGGGEISLCRNSNIKELRQWLGGDHGSVRFYLYQAFADMDVSDITSTGLN